MCPLMMTAVIKGQTVMFEYLNDDDDVPETSRDRRAGKFGAVLMEVSTVLGGAPVVVPFSDISLVRMGRAVVSLV